MYKTIIVAILTTLLIIIGGVLYFSRGLENGGGGEPLPSPTSYEYYWGDGCPHCKNVEDFLKTWDPPIGEAGKKEKVQITKYEVWSSSNNAKRMQERAKVCGIEPQGMGIPFLVTPEGKCIDGDNKIINYLKNLEL